MNDVYIYLQLSDYQYSQNSEVTSTLRQLDDITKAITDLSLHKLFTKYQNLDLGELAESENLIPPETDGKKIISDTSAIFKRTINLLQELTTINSSNQLKQKSLKRLHVEANDILENFKQIACLIHLIEVSDNEIDSTKYTLTNAISLTQKTLTLIEQMKPQIIKTNTIRGSFVSPSSSQITMPSWPTLASSHDMEEQAPKRRKIDNPYQGSKLEVIQELISFTESRKLEGIQVPQIIGLNTLTIRDFLKTYSERFETLWSTLCASCPKEIEQQKSFLNLKSTQDCLAQIKREIGTTFKNHYQHLNTDQIKSWLEQTAKNGDYLMVRSSGVEDGRGVVNAGGNLSVSYVLPNPEDFFIAVSKVIGSYFSQNSLENRINANDNPFTDQISLTVASQILIGEELNGSKDLSKIPVSVVMFSNEPLYVGTELFRIVSIVATYGHGEGVVNEMEGIAKDTILAFHSISNPGKMYIVYDNQEKKIRLAPKLHKDKPSLFKVQNPSILEGRRALSDTTIERLVRLAIEVEAHLQFPAVDMELVVKDNTIYPVQARPIIRPESRPSYVEIDDMLASQIPMLYTQVVLPGNADVMQDLSKSNILISTTLAKAERSYDPALHKAIIIHTQEKKNTHAIANFSSLGVPCFFVSDPMTKVFFEKANESNQIVLCTHTGRFFVIDRGQTLKIKQGYAIHPATLSPSLNTDSKLPMLHSAELDHATKELFLQLRAATTQQATQNALDQLRGCPSVEKLKSRKRKITEILDQMEYPPEQAKKVKLIMGAIEQEVEQSINEAQHSLLQYSPSSLTSLFRLSLVTSVFKNPEEQGVEKYDVMSSRALLDVAKLSIVYQNQLTKPGCFIDEALLAENAPADYVKNQWNEFLVKLENEPLTEQEIQRFKNLMKIIEKHGICSEWMLFFFSPVYRDSLKIDENSTKKCFNFLINNSFSNQATLSELLKTSASLKQQTLLRSGFADPKMFAQAFTYHNQMMDQITPEKLKLGLNDRSILTKLVTLQTMSLLVDLFDNRIKELKSSSEFTVEEKIANFKEMLKRYLALLESWHEKLIIKDSISYKSPFLVMEKAYTLPEYLEKMRQICDECSTTNPDMLKPSPDFSVSGALIGNQTALDRHWPNTLEDLFTLTHQNLLLCIGVLYKSYFAPSIHSLDQEILNYHNEISKLFEMLDIKLNAVFVSPEGIKFIYCIPLRNHGLTLSVYLKKQGIIEITPSFMGELRWENSKKVIELVAELGLLQCKDEPELSERELKWTWQISNPASYTFAINLLQLLASDSISDTISNTIVCILLKDLTLEKYSKEKQLLHEAERLLQDKGSQTLIHDDNCEKFLLNEELMDRYSFIESVKILLFFKNVFNLNYYDKLCDLWIIAKDQRPSSQEETTPINHALLRILDKQNQATSNEGLESFFISVWMDSPRMRDMIHDKFVRILSHQPQVPELKEYLHQCIRSSGSQMWIDTIETLLVCVELDQFSLDEVSSYLGRILSDVETDEKRKLFLNNYKLQTFLINLITLLIKNTPQTTNVYQLIKMIDYTRLDYNRFQSELKQLEEGDGYVA